MAKDYIGVGFSSAKQAAIARDYFIINNKIDDDVNKRNFSNKSLKKARKKAMSNFFKKMSGKK